MPSDQSAFRDIPSVDVLLHDVAFAPLLAESGHDAVRTTIRAALTTLRQSLAAGEIPDVTPKTIAKRVAQFLEQLVAPTLKPVFNLSGTILHTNLEIGRAHV